MTADSPGETLRIGVTGHRADKLDPAVVAALRPAIAAVMQSLKDAASGASATGGRVLQIVSALAEGADRLVAAEGLAAGATLRVVLPFARDLYRRDFATPQSQEEFFALIERAGTVVELNGQPSTAEQRNAAYAAVGEAVVDASDALIAIWNGEPAAGRGGTAEVVDYARRHGRPVLWFTPLLPHNPPRLLVRDGCIDEDALGALLRLVGA